MLIKDQTERDKALRLFKYLRDLNKLNSTSRTNFGNQLLWLNSLPRNNPHISCNVWKNDWTEEDKYQPWVKFKRPPQRNPSCPVFQEASAFEGKTFSLSSKSADLFEAFQNFAGQAPSDDYLSSLSPADFEAVLSELSILATNGISVPYPGFRQYLEKSFHPWFLECKSLALARSAYQNVYAIYHEHQKQVEALEIVLGVGMLTWAPTPNTTITRHLITLSAEIDFDPKTGRITIDTQNSARKPVIETDMLDPGDLGPDRVALVEQELSQLTSTCRDISRLHPVLTIIAGCLGKLGNGMYDADVLADNRSAPTAAPVITFSPAVIVRKRTSRAFLTFLQTVIDKPLDEPLESTLCFSEICECDQLHPDAYSSFKDDASSADPTVYFPLPFNDEQLEIVHKTQESPGVLVLGPPGTGKSHTIANLTCHYLAQGKRILITSQSPRALQVLHNMLPEEVQPLCIQVLGQDSSEQRVLERCVGGILKKHNTWRDSAEDKRISEFRNDLHKHKSRLAEIRNQHRTIREKEINTFDLGTERYSGTMAHAATQLNTDAPKFAWFQDKAPAQLPSSRQLELWVNAIKFLQHHHAVKEYASIDLFELLKAATEAASLVESAKDPVCESTEFQGSYAVAAALCSLSLSEVRAVADELDRVLELVKKLRVVNIGSASAVEIAGGKTGSEWLGFFDSISSKCESLAAGVAVAIAESKRTDSLAAAIDELKDIREIIRHIESGGGFGLFSSKPDAVKQAVKNLKQRYPIIAKTPIEDLEQVASKLEPLETLSSCTTLFGLKIPEVAGGLELQTKLYLAEFEKVKECLALVRLVAKMSPAFANGTGLAIEWANPDSISQCHNAAHARLAQLMAEDTEKRLAAIAQTFDTAALKNEGYTPIAEFAFAVRSKNVKKVAKLKLQMEQDSLLFGKIRTANERLGSIGPQFPLFFRAINADPQNPVWAERAMLLAEASRWQSANQKVTEYLATQTAGGFQRESDRLGKRIRQVTSELASALAWQHCFKRMTDNHRRNLVAWQKAMEKALKRFSKQVLQRRAEAQERMASCREFIPAWIMPLHRVYESIPPKASAFDIIIVDEASQCGQDATPLLWLGKQVIVVGDDKQISPTPVGVQIAQITQLNNTYLNDFQYRQTFDPDRSFFDHCHIRFRSSVALREHFRCMPEIIRFSNDLCYSANPLIPVRDYPVDRLEPLVPVPVLNGYAEGSSDNIMNRNEAAAIVAKIEQCMADKAYDDKTFGIITLQGNAQAKLITKMLLERLNPADIEKRRLICGSPYSFQGDQRHIIFISMIVSVSADRRNPSAMVADTFVKRFNVAASRGQDQVYLFHSVNIEQLSKECLRRKLLEHYYSKPEAQPIEGVESLDELAKIATKADRKVEDPPGKFESWFEVDVYLHLRTKGYRVIEQFPINEYRIDLLIEGAKNKLALECDGDHWHGPDRWEQDTKRQRMLERSNWRFYRLLESEYRWNPEVAFAKLKEELDERGVFPVYGNDAPKEEPKAAASDPEPIDPKPARVAPVPKPEPEPKPIVLPARPAVKEHRNFSGTMQGEVISAKPKPKQPVSSKKLVAPKSAANCETVVVPLVKDVDVLTLKHNIYKLLNTEGDCFKEHLSQKLSALFPQIENFTEKFEVALSLLRDRNRLMEDPDTGLLSFRAFST
jgi:very-short-patch-repair endonuclease